METEGVEILKDFEMIVDANTNEVFLKFFLHDW